MDKCLFILSTLNPELEWHTIIGPMDEIASIGPRLANFFAAACPPLSPGKAHTLTSCRWRVDFPMQIRGPSVLERGPFVNRIPWYRNGTTLTDTLLYMIGGPSAPLLGKKIPLYVFLCLYLYMTYVPHSLFCLYNVTWPVVKSDQLTYVKLEP